MNYRFRKTLVPVLAAFLATSVASAKPLTHSEMQQAVETCFQKFSETIWLEITNTPADSNNNLKFVFPNTPGPYDLSSTTQTVTFLASPINSSLYKKSAKLGSTTMDHACTQSLTSSSEDFQVTVDCSDSGSVIPGRKVRKLPLTSLKPAGLPSVSYDKADLEFTYDDAGSRTPDLDLIHKVKIDQPKVMNDAVPFTNVDTNVPTKLTANTNSLYKCLSDELKDLL